MSDTRTPLHSAATRGDVDKARELLKHHRYDVNCRDGSGFTALHWACYQGHMDMARMLISEFQADTTLQDRWKRTPLHVATIRGQEKIALALIAEFGCDTNVRNSNGYTILHTECERGHASIVKVVSKHVSLLATTNDGDTPLHIAAAWGHKECVEALLQLGAPIMLRNSAGKTARDVAQYNVKPLLDTYVAKNRAKIYLHYDKILQQANKKYSNAERIVRIFVIGNPGAGKSSFVETMKREGFFDSFVLVSESSVPPHTAGIVPSIHTSKHYGRVLFYDFAGDPEYYSSHAAILEKLACSKKGVNIFIIVIDLREDILAIRNLLHYWLSFIDYQCGSKNIITIGSHSDLLTKETAGKKISAIQSEPVENQIDYFTLNCCKPRSKELEEIKSRIVHFAEHALPCKLSTEASVLLGLLEKDFSNITACSTQTILSCIGDTGISLQKDITSLMALLRELHDVGLIFIIGDSRDDICSAQVILNISKLTSEVHKLLFSKEAEFPKDVAAFNVGILPQSLLKKLLPQHITKECLVQLQYCQEISQHDVSA